MTARRAISLSDQQLADVISAARVLPLQWRSRYLSGIADRLLLLDEASDVEVQAAITHVLQRLGGRAA